MEDKIVLKILKIATALVTVITFFTVLSPLHADLEDKSLVLYLSFDEGSGNTTKDQSSYGHDAELTANPTWVDGQFGSKALEFDGTKGQYAMVPINDTLQLREQFSVAFWVKRGNAQIRDWNYMVSAGPLKWAVIFNQNNKTYMFTEAPGWGQRGVSDEDQPEDWVHLSVVHDTDKDVSFYYDGKKVGGGSKPPPVNEITGSIMVGARHPGQEFFTGVIDEVYLFNRAISTDEINIIRAGDFAPVQPAEKLTTTWGVIKTNRKH